MVSPKSRRADAGIRCDGAKTNLDTRRMKTMAEPTGNLGFAPPRAGKALSKRRAAALALMATVGLTVSLVVAATAVSMGNRSFARSELIARQPPQMPDGPFDPVQSW
jgi:hypothetical protein